MINPSNYYKNFDAKTKSETKGVFSRIADKIKYVYNEVKKAEEICNNLPIDETELKQIIDLEERKKLFGDF